MKSRFTNEINIKNRQASFQYELIETVIAGIALMGTEIKSIREGNVNLQDGHCYFSQGQIYAKGINITPYAQGTHYNHEAARERKLLLRKSEIIKLESKVEEKGLTLIPIRIFINERGFVKLEIALARGKKIHDKRATIKERDIKRELSKLKIR